MENQIARSQNKAIKITYILCYVALSFVIVLFLFDLIPNGTESLSSFFLGYLPYIIIFLLLIFSFRSKKTNKFFFISCFIAFSTFNIVAIIYSLPKYTIKLVSDYSFYYLMQNSHIILKSINTILLAMLTYYLFKKIKDSQLPTEIINKIYGAVVITFLSSCAYYLLLQSWGFLPFGGLLGLMSNAFIEFFILFILYKCVMEEGFYSQWIEAPISNSDYYNQR